MAAKYKMDKDRLKRGGSVVANLRGTRICKGTGSSAVANIRDDRICKGTGSSAEYNIRRDKICRGTGSSAIASMRDVDKDVDGPSGTVKAAFWLFFVR